MTDYEPSRDEIETLKEELALAFPDMKAKRAVAAWILRRTMPPGMTINDLWNAVHNTRITSPEGRLASHILSLHDPQEASGK